MKNYGVPRLDLRNRCHRPVLAIGSALDLAVTRVAVCAVVLLSAELWDAREWAERAAALRLPPAGLAWTLDLLDTRRTWIPPLQFACAVSTLAALIGLRTRASLALSTVTSLALFALPHLSGGPRHSMHLVWFLAILAVSPCQRRLRFPWRNDWARGERPWALHGMVSMAALRLALASIYFFPGFWKLRESGLEWIFSDNLQNHMYWKWLQFGQLPRFRIDHYPTLVKASALGVVLLELSFPLLMWHWRTRVLAAVLGLSFHLSAGAVMFLPFSALWGCYAMLIDWERLRCWFYDRAWSPHRVSAAAVWSALSSRLELRRCEFQTPIAVVVIGSVLAGVLVQGFRGEMLAYPFACYPTFQWIAQPSMPDLWIRVVRKDRTRWVPDSPLRGGRRPQAMWAAAWRVAGVYGDRPDAKGLRHYFELLPSRPQLAPGDHVRFYRADVWVDPKRWHAPPRALTFLGEIIK